MHTDFSKHEPIWQWGRIKEVVFKSLGVYVCMTLPSCMKEGSDWRTDLAYFKHGWIKLPIWFVFPLPHMSFCMCTCALWLPMYIHATQKAVQNKIFHYQRNKSIACKWVNSICYRVQNQYLEPLLGIPEHEMGYM